MMQPCAFRSLQDSYIQEVSLHENMSLPNTKGRLSMGLPSIWHQREFLDELQGPLALNFSLFETDFTNGFFARNALM